MSWGNKYSHKHSASLCVGTQCSAVPGNSMAPLVRTVCSMNLLRTCNGSSRMPRHLFIACDINAWRLSTHAWIQATGSKDHLRIQNNDPCTTSAAAVVQVFFRAYLRAVAGSERKLFERLTTTSHPHNEWLQEYAAIGRPVPCK